MLANLRSLLTSQLPALAASVLLTAATAGAQAPPGASPEPVVDGDGRWLVQGSAAERVPFRRPELIVKLAAGVAPEQVLASIVEPGKAVRVQPVFSRPATPALKAGGVAEVVAARGLHRVFRVAVSGLEWRQAADRLAFDGRVEWVEPVMSRRLLRTPNDPLLESQNSWGQGHADLWGHHQVRATEAWTVADGRGVLVAVIDSGCDPAHPDLAANLWRNPGEIDGNGLDDDGNGYVDDVRGWDFFGTWDAQLEQFVDDNQPTDENGHGTHVAGTVAAVADNGLGLAGIAHGAEVLCLQGLGAGGVGFSDDLAEAILYAVSAGAEVLNLSWGGEGFSQVIDDTLAVAHELGVVSVAAAGNDAGPTADLHPASSAYVINVGASDPHDRLTYFSNFGSGLDLLAPGGGVLDLSDDNVTFVNMLSLRSAIHIRPPLLEVGDAYLRLQGTSMAAPHVAGAAALLLERRPQLSPEAVRQALRASAAGGYSVQAGYGRLDAAAALDERADSGVRLLAPRPGAYDVDRIEVHGLAGGGYVLEHGPGSQPSSWTTIARAEAPVNGELATWDVAELPDGVYTLRLRAEAAELTYEDRVEITLDRVSMQSPTDDLPTMRLGDLVAVTGDARGGDFSRFRVEWQDLSGDWRQDSVQLTGDGLAPVAGGVLAVWDTSVLYPLNTAEFFALRLVVERGAGEPVVEESTVIVDPWLRAGWPVRLGRSFLGIAQLVFSDHLLAVDVDGNGGLEIPVALGHRVDMLRHDGSSLPGWPRSTEDVYPDNPGFVQQSPLVVDVDRDGDLEVLLAQASGFVAAWHHDGEPVAGWPKPLGRVISLSDLDGDGVPEIIGTDPYLSARVFDLEGSEFLPQPLHRVADGTSLERSATGDLDGDGLPEIVFVLKRGDESSLLAFDGDGAPLPGWPVETGRSIFGSAPALGDLDGDGRLETVHVDTRCVVTVVSPAGEARRFSAPPGVTTCANPTLGDVDGDGTLDIVVGAIRPAPIDQPGGFNVLLAWRADGSPLAGFPVEAPCRQWSCEIFGFGTAALADVDGDGASEIAVGAYAYPDRAPWRPRGFYVFGGDGTAKLEALATSGGDSFYGQTPLIADLDADGRVELAWANEAGDVSVWDLPQDGSAAAPAEAWPMFRHDPWLSGSLPASGEGGCVDAEVSLCLAGRFAATVRWRDFDGNEGIGRALPLTGDTGAFWFFAPANLELMVKVVDGRGFNGHFWVFFGALSNVEFQVTVRDLETGRVRTYFNPSGRFASVGDTEAFSAEP